MLTGATSTVTAYEPETAYDRHRKCVYQLAIVMRQAIVVMFVLQFGYCCWLLNRIYPVCPLAGKTNPTDGATLCAAPYCAYDCVLPATECKCQIATRYRAASLMTGFAICAFAGICFFVFLLVRNPRQCLPAGGGVYQTPAGTPRERVRSQIRTAAGFCTVLVHVLVLASVGTSVSQIGTDDTNWVPRPASIFIIIVTVIQFIAYCSFVGFEELRDALESGPPQRRLKAKPLLQAPVPQPAPTKADPTEGLTPFPPKTCPDYDTTKIQSPAPQSPLPPAPIHTVTVMSPANVAPPPERTNFTV